MVISRQFDGLMALSERGRVLDSPGVRTMLRALSLEWDEELYTSTEQLLLYRAYPRLVGTPFFPQEQEGEISLGFSGQGNFGLDRNSLNQGLLVVGRSGAGKTVFIYHLLAQLINGNIPFWAFDLKRDYRHLLKENQDLVVMPWSKFKINPLRPPPGIETKSWIQIFADVFCHSNALLSGSKNFIITHLFKLFELYGVFNGEERYPSMHEFGTILNQIRKPKSAKNAWYLETVKNRINSILLSLGEVLDCEHGHPLEELLKRNVVFELDGITSDSQAFLIELLLVWTYCYRLAQGSRGSLRHCIVFDEAKKIFDVNKERRPAAGIPIIDLMTDRAREFGEALIVGDQEPSKLTDSIKANTICKVMLSLGHGKDIQLMARSMGLDEKQVQYSYELKCGEGIAKLAGSEPVPIKIPHVEIRKDVTDERVARSLAFLLKDFHHVPRHVSGEFQRYLNSAGSKQVSNGLPNGNNNLSREGKRILLDIRNNPFRKTGERYRKLGLSSYKGNKATRELLDQGLVKGVEIRWPEGAENRRSIYSRKTGLIT